MATALKWEAFRAPTPSAGSTGTFSIAETNAVVDFVFFLWGLWIVIYHTTT